MRILKEGTRLADRYTLIRRLGAGGMSEVWLASDRRLDKPVALKFLTGDAASLAARGEWLKKEWRIGSRLMHPNIIRVFEFHDDPDGVFFALQYVGDTSIAVLAGEDPAASMRPIGLIADALRYAHGKDVVHRDVKASNILLDSRGIPYLLDFGVAAPRGEAAGGGTGSAVAMSPQQRAGGAADAADDIYALGVLMHELLTGAPPGGERGAEVAIASADGTPLPAALVSLVASMLAVDAADRPDAGTVAQRLTEAGFPPAPAPTRFVPGAGAGTGFVDTVEPVSTFRRATGAPDPDAEPRDGATGVSPMLLYGALGLAVAVFLAVVFVLPNVVDRERPAVAGSETVVGEQPASGPVAGDDAATSGAGSAAAKAAADEALGTLLSQLERLRARAIERWGGQAYLDAMDAYATGDQAYVDRNYRLASEKYRDASRMLEPFFDRIGPVFQATMASARAAFEAPDPAEAIRLYDLAVAITPGNPAAQEGLERARNLAPVLSLMEQGLRFEQDLELAAAKLAVEKALALDAQWKPATVALARIEEAIRSLAFEQRMTEAFSALAAGDFASARAAFNAAKLLDPDSREPVDGLLQVDQEARLAQIQRLESVAARHEAAEEWETAVGVYEEVLKIDPDLQFARQGLATARSRSALHARLQEYIDKPDSLSEEANMQNATRLLLDVTRMDAIGPRLADQKEELARLLKRAATPLPVQLVSDHQTRVSIFKVGRFGTFGTQELALKPGTYIASGYRPGYRDVRVEFRVAPEIEMEPVVVQCEEPI